MPSSHPPRLVNLLRAGPRWATLLGLLAMLTLAPAHAAPPAPPSPFLPPAVSLALAQAQVPPEAMVAFVQEVGAGRPLLAWRPDEPVNPASLMKLVTTFAALDLLGPAWTWATPVWLDGPVADGVLDGNLVIQGRGDPKLVLERVWLLLRRVQQLGVREIRGDIVLDRSAFPAPELNPADFDGEPRRPYNVQPDALLLNQKTVTYTFTPDAQRGVTHVAAEPALAEAWVAPTLPLSAGPCEDWRGALQPDLSDPQRPRFGGSFALACGEKQWAVADAEPASYNARLLAQLWRELGGSLGGQVRDGSAPSTAPTFELRSPPLAEVVRDINKFSNNVMAQQLFLSLGLSQRGNASPQAARATLRQWLTGRVGRVADVAVLDNGSGLSRHGRVSARLLARVLQAAWASPVMPELMASLPVAGLDGTLRNSRAAVGRAHLKTGSLRDVLGVAGYVLTTSGRRYVVAAVINHDLSDQARPALSALVQWVADDARR
jgi:D-alanyl-D-alanine carboxypeptidase/D-alanyl-D-alanine-endopeptidase (penicillin-binding protein 4)